MKSYFIAHLDKDGACVISYLNEHQPLDENYCSEFHIRPFYEKIGYFSIDQLFEVVNYVIDCVNSYHEVDPCDDIPLFLLIVKFYSGKVTNCDDPTDLFVLLDQKNKSPFLLPRSCTILASSEYGINPVDFVRGILSFNTALTAYEYKYFY